MNKGLYVTPNQFVSFSEMADKQSLTQELATRKNRYDYISSYLNYLPDPDPILRKLGEDITVYRDLLSDSHVWSVTEQRKAAVKSLEWQIVREESNDKIVDFIEDAFEEINIDNLIDQILNAPLFGMVVLERVWMQSGKNFVYEKIEEKPVEWFGFDDENQLLLFTENMLEGEVIIGKDADPKHLHKWILVQNKPEYRNPFGARALSKCFWPVAFKRGGMKFWVKMVEKFGSPWLVGKQPRGTGETATLQFLGNLEAMVQDAVAVIPDDSSVDVHESKGAASSDLYKEFRQANNDEISKAILTQTLTTEIGEKGTYSASQTHSEMLDNLALSDKKLVQNALNQIIESLVKLNFGDNNIPKFDVYEEDDVNNELAERTKTLKDIGVKPTRKFISEKFNLKDDDFILDWESEEENSAKVISEKGKKKEQKREVEDPNLEGEEFSEPAAAQAIKDLIKDAIPDNVNQQIAEEAITPVIELLNKTNNYDEAFTQLSEAFPKMKTGKIEELLQKVIFISNLEGMFTAQNESEQ